MAAKVTLILKGLIAVFVKPDKSQCLAGVLSQVPPSHKLKILFKKPGTKGMQVYKTLEPPDIGYNLRLDVQNISQQQISFRNLTTVNRQADPLPTNQDSFSWVVDLENIELYDRSIGALLSAFSPILTFTNGDLFAKAVSKGPLFTQRGIFENRRFGFVGTTIGADFPLDQAPNSTAVFFNGQDPIAIPNPSENWEIEINNDADAHTGIVTDANHYYRAVGLNVTELQRFLFMSDALGGGPAGPEAACFSGFLGRSWPTG